MPRAVGAQQQKRLPEASRQARRPGRKAAERLVTPTQQTQPQRARLREAGPGWNRSAVDHFVKFAPLGRRRFII
ncbi:MAG: hypothetical protein WD118_04260 [Phycisphaeraceae bacterium]